MNTQRPASGRTNKTSNARKAEIIRRNRLLQQLKIAVAAAGVVLAGLLIWVAVDTNKAKGSGEGEQPTSTPYATVSSGAQDPENGAATQVSFAGGFDDSTSVVPAPTSYQAAFAPEDNGAQDPAQENNPNLPSHLNADPTPTPAPTPTPTPEPTPAPTPAGDPTPKPKPVKLDHVYEIEVDKSKQVVTVYTVGETGYYDLIVKQFLCSTGHCDKVEDGWYKISDKYRWKEMGNGSYAQYASRISGPYLFHSACYYKAKVNQLKVRYYENLGTNASSGCIRLTAGDANWIYTNCPKGTPIHVITSGERDEALIEALKPPALISQQYDPTDPETPDKYRYKPDAEPTPDPTPYPGVTPAPTPSWTVHPTLKAWGYC